MATARRVLLPFSDDSTLFFADRMRDLLAGSDIEAELAWLAHGAELSPRQLSQVLPDGPGLLLRPEAFAQPETFAGYDAMLVSRIFPPLRDMLLDVSLRHDARRPAVLAFQGGLEFDPKRGFYNRRFADAVFLTPRSNVHSYEAWARNLGQEGGQYVGFGHPTFMLPQPRSAPISNDVYFFAQAVSPLTRPARRHMVDVLAALARAHPDRNIWLKLRHLPGENEAHLHRERYAYPDLMRDVATQDLPNLRITAEPTANVLPRVGVGLTCTSTAAVDLIRAGVPTLVYLDYVEQYLDPLVQPMRSLFENSGLIASLEDVLALRTRAPEPSWVAEMFVGREALIQQIHDALTHFEGRPDLVHRVLPPFAASAPFATEKVLAPKSLRT